jgi:hypothetical protein
MRPTFVTPPVNVPPAMLTPSLKAVIVPVDWFVISPVKPAVWMRMPVPVDCARIWPLLRMLPVNVPAVLT